MGTLARSAGRCRSERFTISSRHAPVRATSEFIFGPW